LQEDPVKELEIFGFTPNQAKVHLSIVRAGSISVGKIAESSKLYRQDIYKIIPKLERKGVISKTLGKPLVVRAMPVKKALKTLVSKERISALQRIKRMEVHLE
jgi:sugar-specific transcriptional regulator TrmB